MSKIGDNPYPGSRAFQQADHARFFGRAADTATIVDLWLANLDTIVVGPVASGKTSLLLAGVYPAMPVKPGSVLPPGDPFRGMTFPFAAFPEQNPFTLGLLCSWSPADLPTRLAGLSISDFLRPVMRRHDGPCYVAIDQLDNLILDNSAGIRRKWRHQFLAELVRARADHDQLHLLLVVRPETVSLLPEELRGGVRHALSGLTAEEALAAVTQPALAAGRTFIGAAAASLVEDLRTTRIAGSRDERPRVAAYVEPSLLQAACSQLWDELPGNAADISEWDIRKLFDVDAALATHCEQMMVQVAAEYDTTPRLLRSWLLDNLVIDGRERGGIYEGGTETAGQPNAVPRSLLNRHLLTCDIDNESVVRHYRLLSSRLIEPLRIAVVDRRAASITAEFPEAASFLAAAKLDLTQGELDFAWQHAERVLEAKASLQEHAQAESVLGNVAYEQGKPAEAAVHYGKASDLLQAAGDTQGAAHQLAAVGQVLLLLGEGHTTEALQRLRAAVDRGPSVPGLRTQLALALWKLGDGKGAVAELTSVLAAEGGYAEARRARGEILADLGYAKDALADLGRTGTDRPSLRAARALAHAQLGGYPTASSAASEVMEIVEDSRRNGTVLLYAARALDLTGNKDSARALAGDAIDATDPPLSRSHRQLALKLAGHRLAPRPKPA
jgi:tetratricopeptide (TPR) repeat protein